MTFYSELIPRLLNQHGLNTKFSLSTAAQVQIEEGMAAFNQHRQQDGLPLVQLVYVPASATPTKPGEHSLPGFEFREV